jgi:1-acyl-sn-glycerol-3-phosphate acyltransferase
MLWGSDPERMWPWARRLVAPTTMWLAPSYGYGLERVPAAGGGVAAINHLSAIDPTLVGGLSPRTLYFMAKAELLEMPVVGDVLMWTGAFPVRRGEGDRDSLRLAREIAREGHMVGVFVEGTRQKFGYPGDVLPGAMMIALQEEVPIVPCGVYSFGWSRSNRMPCAVVWGEPIDLGPIPKSGRGYKRAAELVGDEIRHLWRQAGEAIAAGFPETLPDGARRSGRVYPPFRDVTATPSSSTSVKKAAA